MATAAAAAAIAVCNGSVNELVANVCLFSAVCQEQLRGLEPWISFERSGVGTHVFIKLHIAAQPGPDILIF